MDFYSLPVTYQLCLSSSREAETHLSRSEPTLILFLPRSIWSKRFPTLSITSVRDGSWAILIRACWLLNWSEDDRGGMVMEQKELMLSWKCVEDDFMVFIRCDHQSKKEFLRATLLFTRGLKSNYEWVEPNLHRSREYVLISLNLTYWVRIQIAFLLLKKKHVKWGVSHG